MQWTTERPTKIGYYWVATGPFDPNPDMIEVYEVNGEQCVFAHGTDQSVEVNHPRFNNHLWFGPVDAPPFPVEMVEKERDRIEAERAAAERNADRERVLRDLNHHVQRETDEALHAALKSIPGASELSLFDLVPRLTRKVIGDTEAIYFDETPVVLVHPLEVIGTTATRRVERLL